MKLLSHRTAKASHYDADAKHYDAFNEANSRPINKTIEAILRKHKVKSVLDLTCGTGSQVFWLAEGGYDVVGYDINAKMLKVAKSKATKSKLAIKFQKGDMRTTKAGKFDAVLTIFNAIGHLTKRDFEKTIRNVYRNLNDGGIYIFDIFNLAYLLNDNNITELTIDWQKTDRKTKLRDVQYSTIDSDGVLASYTTSYIQKGRRKPKISQNAQTLQVYTAKQLKTILEKFGFKVIKQTELDGSKFVEDKSKAILTVAKKIGS